MQNFAEVIDALGGSLKVAESLGLSLGTVSSMKTRSSIAPEYWPVFVDLARRAGRPDITIEMLAAMKQPRRRAAQAAEATP